MFGHGDSPKSQQSRHWHDCIIPKGVVEYSSGPKARSWLFRQEKSDRRALLQDSEVSKSMCMHPVSHNSNTTRASIHVNRGSSHYPDICRLLFGLYLVHINHSLRVNKLFNLWEWLIIASYGPLPSTSGNEGPGWSIDPACPP